MLTKQEMFTRAFLGLRAQGWRPSTDSSGACRYDNGSGCRCAWGHVDPEGTSCDEAEGLNVWALAEHKIGIAAQLNQSEIAFAGKLQAAHDDVVVHTGWGRRPDMEANLRALAAEHRLEVPE